MSPTSNENPFESSIPFEYLTKDDGNHGDLKMQHCLNINVRRSWVKTVASASLGLCFTLLLVTVILLCTFASRYPVFLTDLRINTIPGPPRYKFPFPPDDKLVEALHIGLESSSLSDRITRFAPHTHMVHSHNDETRRYPLFEALSLGVRSVETDVHSFPSGYAHQNATIYVGHSKGSLTSYRTLNDLYLSPLETLLDGTNSRFDPTVNRTWAGVFHNEPGTSLQLLLDIKNEPEHTIALLNSGLQRLWNKGYLTYHDRCRSEWVLGPITVVLSGDVPQSFLNKTSTSTNITDLQCSTSSIASSFSQSRVMFVDAPLGSLNSTHDYTSGLACMASASLKQLLGEHSYIGRESPFLSSKQTALIKKHIDQAHDRGLETRIWDTPQSPASVRIGVLRQLFELGSDWANADYLKEAVRDL